MSLIKCSECGKDISDKASACPNCGAPSGLKSETSSRSKQPFILRRPISGKTAAWVTVAALVLLWIGSHSNNSKSSGTETILHSFRHSDPTGNLILDQAGNVYGVTIGESGRGAVFKIAPDGTETVFHSVSVPDVFPKSFILDHAGNLYGATSVFDMVNDRGAVFKIAPDGSGTILRSFRPGTAPYNLVIDRAGNLFGAAGGGKYNGDLVFEITSSGAYRVLHSFRAVRYGGTPFSAAPNDLVLGQTGNLYGVTASGGAHKGGSVFEITSSGTYRILHSFQRNATPNCLVIDRAGNLFGAAGGGAHEDGSVFEITSSGTYQILHSFGANGRTDVFPGQLVLDHSNNLFAITEYGGRYNGGLVFEITSSGTYQILHSFRRGPTRSHLLLREQRSLVIDRAGNLFGTTAEGGIHNAGAVFEITSSGTYRVVHSFRRGPAIDWYSDEPHDLILDHRTGTLFGITKNGGKYKDGSIFKIN